jgi:tRNA(Ile)-lysidine synthase
VNRTFGWRFKVEDADPGDYLRERGSLDVVLAAESIKGQLYSRSYDQGDSMKPLGLNGTKRVSDVLSEMGVTEAARKRLPLVCDLLGPIWVPGGPIAERVKVTPDTRRCFRVGFEPV